jgi:hypothetical protein
MIISEIFHNIYGSFCAVTNSNTSLNIIAEKVDNDTLWKGEN